MKPTKFLAFTAAAILGLSTLSLASFADTKDDAKETKKEAAADSARPKSKDLADLKAKSGKGKGKKDPHIKTARAANRPSSNRTQNAPPSKGGPATRSIWGGVHIDNQTDLIWDVYLDGEYRGTTGGYGDLYRTVVAGNTNVYVRADFDDGSYEWHEFAVYIPNDVYIRIPIR